MGIACLNYKCSCTDVFFPLTKVHTQNHITVFQLLLYFCEAYWLCRPHLCYSTTRLAKKVLHYLHDINRTSILSSPKDLCNSTSAHNEALPDATPDGSKTGAVTSSAVPVAKLTDSIKDEVPRQHSATPPFPSRRHQHRLTSSLISRRLSHSFIFISISFICLYIYITLLSSSLAFA